MYKIFLFSIVTAFSIMLTASTQSHAKNQNPSGSIKSKQSKNCEDIRTTADAMDCVNNSKQSVQDKMSAVYQAVFEKQTEKNKNLLNASQITWLAYRDSQCAWEAAQAENPSLKRIYELSCITLLTNMRSELLATILERELDEQPREFGTQPRWMNVLTHDYPDIFWRYGDWLNTDLNCDGINEEIMIGATINYSEQKKSAPDNKDLKTSAGKNAASLVIAVTKNPSTGRPDPQLIHIPLNSGTGKAPKFCHPSVDMTITEKTDIKPAAFEKKKEAGENTFKSKEKIKSCNKAVRLKDPVCAPLYLYWDQNSYKTEYKQTNE